MPSSCWTKSTSLALPISAAIRPLPFWKSWIRKQNNSFRDHYLDVAFDLSRVSFITTANVLDTIPSGLALIAWSVITELPGYTEEEKVQIAKRYLAPRGRDNERFDA